MNEWTQEIIDTPLYSYIRQIPPKQKQEKASIGLGKLWALFKQQQSMEQNNESISIERK